MLATHNGRLLLLNSLRLLVRTSRFVDVWLPQANWELGREAASLAKSVQFTEPVNFLEKSPEYVLYDAILSVGAAARPDLPWTVVNSNGWLARVSSGGTSLSAECSQTNPVGALAAASLGVSEVFKRLLRLKPERGPYFDNLRFSCYTLVADADDPGPSLPETIALPTTLVVGQGAIGNGITLLLSQMEFAGIVWFLDRQVYGPENLGTCVLLGADGLGAPKAEWNAVRFFGTQTLRAEPIVAEFDAALPKFGSRYPYPSVVLNGLDNVPARHAVQDLWPDLLVDGAIGDFACQVVTHAWELRPACLKCLFTEPPTPDPHFVASLQTGLSMERVQQAEDVVTQKDIEQARPEMREKLRAQLGQKICSVVSDAVIAQMSADAAKSGFSPSVPFVATMSAAMVVAELTKYLLNGPTTLAPRFYFDVLQGPQQGEKLRQRPKASCYCQIRRSLIEGWRQGRTSCEAH